MNTLSYDELDKYIAQNYHRHCQATPDVSVETLSDFKALMKGFEGAFNDGQVEIFELIAEGDFVAFVGTYRGTHSGPMGAFAATGKAVDSEFAGYHRFEDGKIVETWVTWDNLAMLQQLGLFPPAPADNGHAPAVSSW
jgi:predicted ester cyclase